MKFTETGVAGDYTFSQESVENLFDKIQSLLNFIDDFEEDEELNKLKDRLLDI